MNSGDGEIIKSGDEYLFKLSHFSKNPVVKPEDFGLVWEEDGVQKKGAIFNPGAERFYGKTMLLPRCHKNYRRIWFYDEEKGFERYGMENYVSEICILSSDDGIHFSKYREENITGDGKEHQDFLYGIEDIRIMENNGLYFLIGCGKVKPPFKGGNADRIAIYTTKDFKNIEYHGIIEAFAARNTTLLFTDTGTYIFLRFYPNINVIKLPDLDVILNPKKHTNWWKEQYEHPERSLLLKTGTRPHESEKIGVGTQLIPARSGWLFIYHAVGNISTEITHIYGLNEEIKRGYSVNMALLDYEHPERIIAKAKFPVYIPHKPYEYEGNETYPLDIPYVVFPTGAILDGDHIIIYAGVGDKYVELLSGNIQKIEDYLLRYGEK